MPGESRERRSSGATSGGGAVSEADGVGLGSAEAAGDGGAGAACGATTAGGKVRGAEATFGTGRGVLEVVAGGSRTKTGTGTGPGTGTGTKTGTEAFAVDANDGFDVAEVSALARGTSLDGASCETFASVAIT